VTERSEYMSRDSIYSEPVSKVKEFVFDEQVADVFDDMVVRSVPHYAEVQRATAQLAAKLIPTDGVFLDLGCSTGTTLLEVGALCPAKNINLIGIDKSEPMLQRCRERIETEGLENSTTLICGDVLTEHFPKADLVALNYTLQFLPPAERRGLLSRVVKALKPGGALILTEKIRHPDRRIQEIFTDIYYDFKRDNNYSELEISQKRDALERVLIPFSLEENLLLLRHSGFSSAEIYLKWVTFATFVAVIP